MAGMLEWCYCHNVFEHVVVVGARFGDAGVVAGLYLYVFYCLYIIITIKVTLNPSISNMRDGRTRPEIRAEEAKI